MMHAKPPESSPQSERDRKKERERRSERARARERARQTDRQTESERERRIIWQKKGMKRGVEVEGSEASQAFVPGL
jgi:hypothetical protein